MRLFLSLFLFGFSVNVRVAHAGDAEDRNIIKSKTNLTECHIIDTTCDSYGEDHWRFGPREHGLDTQLVTYFYTQRTDVWKTRWLAAQAEAGRVTNLGHASVWQPRPDVPKLQLSDDPDGNWIVLTDMEPDDRLALMLLSQTLKKENVLAVGATLLHSGRKTELARRLLKQIGWSDVRLVQGNGGTSETYPATASNAAARAYLNEGKGLIADSSSPSSSGDLQILIQTAIAQAQREKKRLNFLVLSPTTDLANALLSDYGQRRSRSSLKDAGTIGRVIMTGGWVETRTAEDEVESRSTYNWNMDPFSARVVLDLLPVTLISSHLIKPTFGGGSLNASNAPAITQILTESPHPAFADFRQAGASWDHHLIEMIPPLKTIVGPYAGRQFTPADVVAAALVTQPTFASRAQKNVRIELDLDNSTDKGSRIRLGEADQLSVGHEVISEVDAVGFKNLLERAMHQIDVNCETGLLEE